MADAQAVVPKVDKVKAYRLRVINRLSFEEIGQLMGVSRQAIAKALASLNHLIPDPEQTKAYQEVRPDILSSVEEQLVTSLMDRDKIAKANLNNVAYALTQVSSLRRLETGQSTANINTISRLIGLSDDGLFGKQGRGIGRGQTDEPVQAPDKTEGSDSE